MLTGKIKMTIGPDLHAKVGSTLRGSVAGVDDHRKLRYRDELNQHPMKAITGLVETIKNINERSATLVEDVRDLKIAAQYVDIAIGELAETDLYLSEHKQDNLESYLKSASIVGGSLRIVKNDDEVVEFTPQSGGGSNTSLELINEIALDESSSSIRIDKDVNGNAFTLNRAILFIFLPTTNDGAEHNFYFQSTTYPYISFGGISGGKTTIVIEAEKNGFIRATRYQYGRDFHVQRIVPSAATGNDGKIPGNITMVRTANFSGNMFPVGTVFKLMGVKA